MNRKDFLELFNGTRDDFVAEAMAAEEGTAGRKRVWLIAVAVAVALLLAGCGVVYLLSMGSLAITDRPGTNPYLSDGTITQRIIAIGGPQGTKEYRAAKEWYDFEIPYVRTHEWNEEFVSPAEYELYMPYSQKMVDKLEEITGNYGLKPMGQEIIGQTKKGLLDYLGIYEVLLPEAPAKAEDVRAQYYEGGRLSVFCKIKMEEGEGCWPYPTYTVCTYSPKGYFDNGVFILDDAKKWQEWNYTTASGDTFLILYNPEYFEAYAICDQGDRVISLYIETTKQLYDSYRFSEELMSPKQVEELLEVFDFSLKPKPGDPALLSGLPGDYDSTQRTQSFGGFTVELKEAVSDGNYAWITLGITLPEDTVVANVDPDTGKTFWNLKFGGLKLQCEGAENPSLVSGDDRDEGDGLDNTLEYVIAWTKMEPDENMGEDAKWSLTLEGMHQRLRNPKTEKLENVWENEKVWKFDFTFEENSDYRKLEFITEPTEIPTIIGETEDEKDKWGTMTVTELTLRTHSLSMEIQEEVGYGDLCSWREDKDPVVVLKDGGTIALRGYNGRALDDNNTICRENLLPERPIPMDEVEHILLVDGTKLYPVE